MHAETDCSAYAPRNFNYLRVSIVAARASISRDLGLNGVLRAKQHRDRGSNASSGPFADNCH